MSDSINIVILAAGKGTRIPVDTPKPLLTCLGRPLLSYSLDEGQKFAKSSGLKPSFGLVVGHKKELIQEYFETEGQEFKGQLSFATQEPQNGTAHAVQCFFEQQKACADNTYTLVMCADTPLLQAKDFNVLLERMKEKNFDAIAASFVAPNPYGYGRIVRSDDCQGFKIVEHKDASVTELTINEVNSALYLFKTAYLTKFLSGIDNKNASNEFYLTDIFQPAREVESYCFPEAQSFLGVNDFAQLEVVERHLSKRKCLELMNEGVRFQNSDSVTIWPNVEVGKGSEIGSLVTIKGESKIGSNSIIGQGCVINNGMIQDGTEIKPYSYIDQAIVRSNAKVGPYAHLRPQADIGEECRIGNFVEIKKATFKPGSKASHLSYIGDAEIGEGANLGCGFITCNYDGANKHKTIIGKNTFVGSDSQVIAPINIGSDCYVASGSTVNQDMADGSFAIARTRQVTKEGVARRFLKKKK